MSRGDQAGALSCLKFTNHRDWSGALGGKGDGMSQKGERVRAREEGRGGLLMP